MSNKPTKTKSKMKTMRFLSMAALALVGAVTVGCSSDDNTIDTPQQPAKNVVTLTTTVSLDGGAATTRALTAAGVKTFAAGETMALVYKNTSSETVKAVSAALADGDITNEGKSATFTFELTDPDRLQNVTYIYPAAMAKADGSVNYDALATQNGTLATLSSTLDLATYSAAWNAGSLPAATLENRLAILALTLKNSTGSSTITSGLTQVTVSDGTNTYTVTPTSSTFGTDVIYVAIRPTSSADISVTATDGTTNYTKSLTGKTYAAGNGYSVSWKMTEAVPEGVINGKFTINGSGTQVYFSKGNLQATYNGLSWSWGFAENQWDYIGDAEGNTKVSDSPPFVSGYSGSTTTVDLFGWVGASSDWTGVAQYGITSSTTTNSKDGYGDNASEALKSDWGNTIGSGWRTLTSAEWTYLFNTRTSGSTVNGTSNARYTHATINTDGTGVNGMILFPDGITVASSEATSWGTVNGNSAWGTQCTSAQWTALAAKGCVFLPAAGCRDGSSVSKVGSSDSSGYYWSSAVNNAKRAYRVNFYSDNLYPASYFYRSYGFSVRLVRDAQ